MQASASFGGGLERDGGSGGVAGQTEATLAAGCGEGVDGAAQGHASEHGKRAVFPLRERQQGGLDGHATRSVASTTCVLADPAASLARELRSGCVWESGSVAECALYLARRLCNSGCWGKPGTRCPYLSCLPARTAAPRRDIALHLSPGVPKANRCTRAR